MSDPIDQAVLDRLRQSRPAYHRASPLRGSMPGGGLLLREFIAALSGAVLDRGSFCRRPEFWAVTYKLKITADSGVLPRARREFAQYGNALGVCGRLPVSGNIENDLSSGRVGSHAVAGRLRHAVGDICRAKTVPCNVIEEPRAHRQAVFVPGD